MRSITFNQGWAPGSLVQPENFRAVPVENLRFFGFPRLGCNNQGGSIFENGTNREFSGRFLSKSSSFPGSTGNFTPVTRLNRVPIAAFNIPFSLLHIPTCNREPDIIQFSTQENQWIGKLYFTSRSSYLSYYFWYRSGLSGKGQDNFF